LENVYWKCQFIKTFVSNVFFWAVRKQKVDTLLGAGKKDSTSSNIVEYNFAVRMLDGNQTLMKNIQHPSKSSFNRIPKRVYYHSTGYPNAFMIVQQSTQTRSDPTMLKGVKWNVESDWPGSHECWIEQHCNECHEPRIKGMSSGQSQEMQVNATN